MKSISVSKSCKFNFYPYEIVGRGSETQLQVGENLSCPRWRLKDGSWKIELTDLTKLETDNSQFSPSEQQVKYSQKSFDTPLQLLNAGSDCTAPAYSLIHT